MDITMQEVGKYCKYFRKKGGYSQADVAVDTGYSVENVSAFENGRTNNARILLWYFAHGMNYNEMWKFPIIQKWRERHGQKKL